MERGLCAKHVAWYPNSCPIYGSVLIMGVPFMESLCMTNSSDADFHLFLSLKGCFGLKKYQLASNVDWLTRRRLVDDHSHFASTNQHQGPSWCLVFDKIVFFFRTLMGKKVVKIGFGSICRNIKKCSGYNALHDGAHH